MLQNDFIGLIFCRWKGTLSGSIDVQICQLHHLQLVTLSTKNKRISALLLCHGLHVVDCCLYNLLVGQNPPFP